MKKMIIMVVLSFIFLNLTGGLKSYAQENKSTAKEEKHIKIITVKDGVTHELDTVIKGNNLKDFIIDKDKKLKWIAADSASGHFSEIKELVNELGKSKGKEIVVIKHDTGQHPVIIRGTQTVGDSGKKVMIHIGSPDAGNENVFYFKEDKKGMRRIGPIPFPRVVRGLPLSPAFRFRQDPKGNVIDLSDPGIISFKKKKMSGGREKITVIRNEVKENEEKTFDVFVDTEGGDLKKMNEPKVVRELEIQKRDLGRPIDRKVEIKTMPETEKK